MELFKLLGTIAIESSGAEKAIDSIQKKTSSLGEGMQKAGKTISGWGNTLTKTVTAGGVAVGGVAFKTAMDFEDSMAKINTIANLTADGAEVSYGQMEKAIMDLSNQTGVSASAIAEDIYNAISAGQGVGDAVNFVSNSTKLAKSGFAETGQSLDVLTTILNAYGMEASEVTRVSDVLIQTQNLGKTTVGELSSTMGKVIPTAKAYDVSLEQVAAGYTIMTANGIATAETTTYMNSMLNEFGKSGTKVSDILKTKTGKSFSELQAQGYTLGDCLQIVNEAAREQGVSFMDMWGSAEAAKAGVTLLGDSSQTFNERLQEMNASTGSTDAAFQKLDTTSLKLSKVLNEAKNILIDLGGTLIELLLPYLKKAAEALKSFAEWFKNLDDGTKEFIVKIGLLVTALGPVLSVVGKVTSGVGGIIKIGGKLLGGMGKIPGAVGGIVSVGSKLGGTVTTVIGFVGKLLGGGGKIVTGIGTLVAKVGGVLIPAISSVGAPVLAVIAVIGTLVGAGVLLYKNWDEIKEFAGRTWEGIKNIVGGAIEGIKGFFSGVGDFIKNNWQGLATFIVNPFVGGFKLIYDNCETFRNFVDGFTDGIKTTFNNIATAVSETVGNMRDALVTKVTEIKDNFISKFEEAKNGVITKVQEMGEKTVEKYGEIKEKAVEKINDLKEATVERFHEVKEKSIEKINEMQEGIVQSVNDIKEKTVAKFEEVKTGTIQKIGELKDKTVEKFTELRDKATASVSEMKDKMSQAVSDLSERVGSKFTELRDGAIRKVTEIKENTVLKFNELKDKAQESVSEMKDKLTSKFEEMKEGIGEKIGTIKDNIITVFGEIAEKAGERINNLADKVSQVFNNIKTTASAAMSSLGSTVSSKVSEIGSSVKSGFDKMGDSAGKAFDTAKGKISDTVGKAKELFNTKWKMPDIKTPHFKTVGTKDIFGVSVPEIKVEWYKEGGIMTKPTAFGINPDSGKVMAGGEAGAEAVAPIDLLLDYIRTAVAEETGGMAEQLVEVCSLLRELILCTTELGNMRVMLNTGETVGALATPMSEAIARIISDKKRGK